MNRKNVFLIKAGILAYILGFSCNFIGTKGWTAPIAVEINPWGKVNSLRFALSDIFYLRAFQLVISVGDIFLAAFICLIFAGLLGNLIAEAKITCQKQTLVYTISGRKKTLHIKTQECGEMDKTEQKTIFVDYKRARMEVSMFRATGYPWAFTYREIYDKVARILCIEAGGKTLNNDRLNFPPLEAEALELNRIYSTNKPDLLEKLAKALPSEIIDLEKPIWR